MLFIILSIPSHSCWEKGAHKMTLRDLEIFLQVSQYGSMRKAAEALFISQPSVSGAVRAIEEEYGVLLFERLNHRLYITPEGRELEARARRILAQFEELEHSLKNSSEHESLRIGATLTIGTCILPEILQAMGEPQATVLVENTRTIEGLLVQGELDIGLVEGKIRQPDLTAAPVMEDFLTAVGTESIEKPITLAELCSRYPLLMREKGSGTRAMVEEALIREGVVWREQWVCSNTQALLRAAEAGLGVTIISRMLAREALESGRLYEIPLKNCHLSRTFRLVWHKDKFQSPEFLHFCRICRAYAEKAKAV